MNLSKTIKSLFIFFVAISSTLGAMNVDSKKSTVVPSQPQSKTSAPIQIRDHELRSFLTKHGIDVKALEQQWDDIICQKVIKPFNSHDKVKKARFIIECCQEKLVENERYHHLTELQQSTIEREIYAAENIINALYTTFVDSWIISNIKTKDFYDDICAQFNGIIKNLSQETSSSSNPFVLCDLLVAIGLKNYDYQGAQSTFTIDSNDSSVIECVKLSNITNNKSNLVIEKVLALTLSYFHPKNLLQRWKAHDQAILSFPLMRVDMEKTQSNTNIDLTLTAYPGAKQDADSNETAEQNEIGQEIANNEPWGWSKWLKAGFLYGLQMVSLQLTCQTYDGLATLWTGRSLQERNALETLGLPAHASATEIKQQYRNLVIDIHPDKCTTTSKEDCTQKFEKIDNAYRLLLPKGKN